MNLEGREGYRTMRDILNLPQIDASKLEAVKQLIDEIAEEVEDCAEKLQELEKITGKQHEAMEFAEYWGWTDLDTLAEITLMPQPPIIRDLTLEEVTELVEIISNGYMEGEDAKAEYYEEVLHRSLPLPDVVDYVMSDGTAAQIAERMMQAAKSSVILL